MFRYLMNILFVAALFLPSVAFAHEIGIFRVSGNPSSNVRPPKPMCKGADANFETGVFLKQKPDGCKNMVRVENENRGTCVVPNITGAALPVVSGLDPRSGLDVSIIVLDVATGARPCLAYGKSWVRLDDLDMEVLANGTVYNVPAEWDVDAEWLEGAGVPTRVLNESTNGVFDLAEGRPCREQDLHLRETMHTPDGEMWITYGQSCR